MRVQKSADDILCEVACIIAPLLRCTWSDLPCTAPAVLFVSHSIRRAFLAAMQNTIALYQCSLLTYELHVHPTPPRHPGRIPQMPLHWVVRTDDHEHAIEDCVTTLWSLSRHNTLNLNRDAWDVIPFLHDGSTSSYDFDSLLFYLEMGSLTHFYKYYIIPILHVVQRLTRCGDRYIIFTYQKCLQRLSLVPVKKKDS